jgi:hypothetical protein
MLPLPLFNTPPSILIRILDLAFLSLDSRLFSTSQHVFAKQTSRELRVSGENHAVRSNDTTVGFEVVVATKILLIIKNLTLFFLISAPGKDILHNKDCHSRKSHCNAPLERDKARLSLCILRMSARNSGIKILQFLPICL